MHKNSILIVGTAAIVAGSVALYIAGTAESIVTALVAGVFVLTGVVALISKKG